MLLLLWLIATLNFSANAELRLLEITEPGTFIADTGRFSDAYYVMTEAPVEVKAKLIYDGVQDLTDMKARIWIYQELSDGSFSQEIFLEKEIFYSIKANEELTIDFELGKGPGEKFFPMTYNNILYSDSTFYYPPWVKNMLWNVTPRYKIEIELLDANSQVISSLSKNVRFFVNLYNDYLLSVEHSTVELNENSTKDEIAGRLNSDSLIKVINYLFYNGRNSYQSYTVLDRAIWFNQAIDYSKYNYVYWADGDDKPIPQVERDNIIRYLNSGKTNLKKYLAICSQELAREHCKEGSQPDSVFLSSYFRVENISPGNPKGKGISCDSIKFKGYSVNRDIINSVKKTEFEHDEPPYCGLVDVNWLGDGLAIATAKYVPDSLYYRTNNAGVSVVNLQKSQVYFAVDWRHFENCDMVVRGIFDFFEKNNGDDLGRRNYFLKETEIGTNYSHYPGEQIEYKYQAGYDVFYGGNDQPGRYYSSNQKVIIENAVTLRIDTIQTNDKGEAYYSFIIPKDKIPGDYQYNIYSEDVEKYDYFKVYNGNMKILGFNSTCNFTEKIYFILHSDYKKNWQVEGGEIISYNSDSTEIIVMWGDKGNGNVKINLLKDSNEYNLELNIAILEKPLKPIISQIGNRLICSDTLRTQWYFEGKTIGKDSNFYDPHWEGIFTCETYNNDCKSEMSEAFYFKKTEVNEPKFESIRIYPNPFSDNLNIEIPNYYPVESEIKVYNSLGILIKELKVSEGEKLVIWDACTNQGIKVSNGIYYIELNFGKIKKLHKVSLIR